MNPFGLSRFTFRRPSFHMPPTAGASETFNPRSSPRRIMSAISAVSSTSTSLAKPRATIPAIISLAPRLDAVISSLRPRTFTPCSRRASADSASIRIAPLSATSRSNVSPPSATRRTVRFPASTPSTVNLVPRIDIPMPSRRVVYSTAALASELTHSSADISSALAAGSLSRRSASVSACSFALRSSPSATS